MAGVWTNNYRALKNAFLCGDFIDGLSKMVKKNGDHYTTVTPTSNDHHSFPIYGPLINLGLGNSSGDDVYLLVGASPMAPAATDYNLIGELTRNTQIRYLSIINEKPVWNTSTGEVSNVVKLTIQNVYSTGVAVAEWGIFVKYGNDSFLIYRAVLDNHVILASNQSATLTLTRSVTLTDPVVWPSE